MAHSSCKEMFSSSNRRARVVDGHVVRDGESSSSSSMGGGFSPRRFVLIAIIGAALVVTNPANEFDNLFQSLRQQVMGGGANNRSRKEDLSDWAWKKLLDPPLSVTNFGIFTLEERTTKVDISALQQVWSCNFYDQRTGAFCNALANHLCHEKPVLYDPQSLAYTAHRCICLLLIGSALLSFCCCGAIPSTVASEPILRAVLTSVCRSNVSLVLLALDLFNATSFVYPALGTFQLAGTLHVLNLFFCDCRPNQKMLSLSHYSQRISTPMARNPTTIHLMNLQW